MVKCRIVKRTHVDGEISYIIQQKHFWFRWWWVDAWVNSLLSADCKDNFDSLEEAQQNLCYFDGSSCRDEVIQEEANEN